MTTVDLRSEPVAEGRHDSILKIEGLSASYGAVQVLRSVDFTVGRGEIVALLGTNGAGKSTILRCISGLLKPDKGKMWFAAEGAEPVDVARMATEETVRQGIVQVPGGRGLLPTLTVEENLRMGAYTIRRNKSAIKTAYDRVYEIFPRLAERRSQMAGLMSGGEAQMLAIGRALMLKPQLMMIDELSLGLAPLIVQNLVEIVRQINAEGVSMILVEQSANLALKVTDHAYFLEKGQIRFDGSSSELLERDDLLRSVFLAAGHTS
ncbi:MAG: branched-chain amino acid transport system ATP-binding protein livF [Acidimicrobiaceae bacterium]|jgi:ABC-type branched-subunit amino acid transport system ATPase component|nr:branched-chain amino acid transport system ATP-binding protein livF [Acidimicrobiaceae bacterium]